MHEDRHIGIVEGLDPVLRIQGSWPAELHVQLDVTFDLGKYGLEQLMKKLQIDAFPLRGPVTR